MDPIADDGNPVDSDAIGTDGVAGDDGFIVVNPGGGSFGNDSSGDSEPRKRRGRKPGSRNTAQKDQASLKGLDIKDILLSIHTLLAIQTGVPEIMLEPDEAAKLDDAIKKVWRHYPVDVSQKQLDISMAIYAFASVYGTRAVSIYMRKRTEAQEAQPQPNVMPFARPL